MLQVLANLATLAENAILKQSQLPYVFTVLWTVHSACIAVLKLDADFQRYEVL